METVGPWVYGRGGRSRQSLSLLAFSPPNGPVSVFPGSWEGVFAGTQGESVLSLSVSRYNFQKVEI